MVLLTTGLFDVSENLPLKWSLVKRNGASPSNLRVTLSNVQSINAFPSSWTVSSLNVLPRISLNGKSSLKLASDCVFALCSASVICPAARQVASARTQIRTHEGCLVLIDIL